MQIITNTSEELLQCDKEEEHKLKEPSQSWSDQNQDIGSIGSTRKQEIFSIKDKTKGKAEIMIVDMIKRELGVKENGAIIWNKMMKAIAEVNLASDSQNKCGELQCLIIDFNC